MFNRGKEFLKKENDETREILKIWNQLGCLKVEYNKIGENIRNAIINHLSNAYPSLQGKKSRTVVQLRDECYVTNNIIKFVKSILMPKILRNDPIKWDKIIPEPVPYVDVSPAMWCLEPFGVHIQSRIKNNVDRVYYQNVLKCLVQKIFNNLKEENNLYEKIKLNLNNFRERMNKLSNDIDLHQVRDKTRIKSS